MTAPPVHVDVDRSAGITLSWQDDVTTFLSVSDLRRHSPSADAKALREELDRNPLAVLPSAAAAGPLTIQHVEMVGNYAMRIVFSDGHRTGIYSWEYLRELAGKLAPADRERLP